MSFEPYTHQQHAKRCREAAQASLVLSNQLVQVRKHGVVYCARLAAPYTVPNGPDCWTVESITPQVARFTVPVRQVVLCGQSDCMCRDDAVPAVERSENGGAAASEVPNE